MKADDIWGFEEDDDATGQYEPASNVAAVRHAYPCGVFRVRRCADLPNLVQVRWAPRMEWLTVTVTEAIELKRKCRNKLRRTLRGKAIPHKPRG